MAEYIALKSKRFRGWPWPEVTFGLSSMVGEEGYCGKCGTPFHAQSGPLTLQRRGLTVSGAWIPNWQFDTICMDATVAEQVSGRFEVDLRPVRWPAASGGDAFQLVIPTVGDEWFEPGALGEMATAHHDAPGQSCPVCGRWRWNPITWGKLPPVRDVSVFGGQPIAASPEWFGSGMQSFRNVVMMRELAELLEAASPRDFAVVEPEELRGLAGSTPRRVPPGVSVPAGAVSEIFKATLLPVSPVQGEPAETDVRKAERARKALENANGLISADALAAIGYTFLEAGELAQARHVWRQAADHGSSQAIEALNATS